MSNDAEKLADIAILIGGTQVFESVEDVFDRVQDILDEPEVGDVLIAKTGYGVVSVNGRSCAVLPFERLREVNSNVAADCLSASQRAERRIK